MVYTWKLLVICLLTSSRKSFVDTAPLSEGGSKGVNTEEDDSVQELENLKKSFGKLGKTLDLIKSHSTVFSDMGGDIQSQSEIKEEVKSDGNIIEKVDQRIDKTYDKDKQNTKVRTLIEKPSQGIHQTIISQIPREITTNGNRRSPANPKQAERETNTIEGVDTGFGIQYSPLDVAEYIFWTGDEKGVTLAIEEFLEAGLMSREEALAFLQDIKFNLENLKSHYTQLGLNSIQRSKSREIITTKQSTDSSPSQELYKEPDLRSTFNVKQLRQETDNKRMIERSPTTSEKISDKVKTIDDDYDEILERLRLADFLYTEYSLEEVIYQLAKVMFTQSLTRGSAEAQQALRKFTDFLEVQAAQGRISRALEKKVLDVLIASLSDTLTEHPELLSVAQQSMGPMASNSDSQKFIRMILDSNLDDDKGKRGENAHEEVLEKEKGIKEIPEKKKKVVPSGYLPFGFPKYKNL